MIVLQKKYQVKQLMQIVTGIINLIELQNLFKFKLINISTGSVFQDIKNSKLKMNIQFPNS